MSGYQNGKDYDYRPGLLTRMVSRLIDKKDLASEIEQAKIRYERVRPLAERIRMGVDPSELVDEVWGRRE
jgi:hypothetical protein